LDSARKSNNKKLLGDRIRYMRRKNDLSQEMLGELLGLDPNSISRIECGVHYPSMETLEKISNTLNLSMRELFPDDREEQVEEMRKFLVGIASELDEKKLAQVVGIIKQII